MPNQNFREELEILRILAQLVLQLRLQHPDPAKDRFPTPPFKVIVARRNLVSKVRILMLSTAILTTLLTMCLQ